MVADDTQPHMQQRLTTVFASMSGAQRLAYAFEMADETKAVALAGIRARHPELNDVEVSVEWLRLLHGDDVADRVLRCSSTF